MSRWFSGKRLRLSFAYAFQGLISALKSEQNLRIHWLASLIVFAGLAVFDVPLVESIDVVLVVAILHMAELINTAIERVVDLVSPEPHPLAKVSKDVAAAAVLVAAVTALIVCILVFWTPVLSLHFRASIHGR